MRNWMGLVAIGVTSISFGQTKDPIVTDRPDFTESAIVVPFKRVQIETGFTYQWSRSAFTLGLPETLFRISTGTKSELRIGLPDYNWQSSNSVRSAGLSDLYLGMKLQIGPFANGDDFALIPAINMPSKVDPFSSQTFDPELKVCWGRSLSAVWGVSAMAYFIYASDDTGGQLVTQTTVSFSRELSGQSGMFFEYAATFANRMEGIHVVHVGWAFRPTSDTQFDIHGGFSLSSIDSEPFIAMGYSVRY